MFMLWKVVVGTLAFVFVVFLLVVFKMAKTEAEELERDLREADKLMTREADRLTTREACKSGAGK